MTERKLLISGVTLGYEGLFDSADLFRFIEDWLKQNGYEKNEIKNIERISEKKKNVQYEIMPWKDISDYARFEIYLRMRITDLVETKVKRNGSEYKINKGNIFITLDAFLATDIKFRWESNPLKFLFRTIFNKFIGKEYITEFEKRLMEDVKNLHSELKAYLNLNRYVEPA